MAEFPSSSEAGPSAPWMECKKTQVWECKTDSIRFDQFDEPVISSSSTLANLRRAASLLQSDDIVAFPTETVYGLASSALSSSAIKRIYAAKGRPADNPLIVHVSGRKMLEELLPGGWTVPPAYEALMEAFWPGPLTLLFPTKSSTDPDPKVSEAATCGRPTVAMRMPSHPVARALIAMSGLPLTAPSANRSGRPSPTLAEHVARDMDGRVEAVLDGGACGVGVESTVVDGISTPGRLKILRIGGLDVEDIESCVSEAEGCEDVKVDVFRKDFRDGELEAKPTTPGMKYKHYSPTAQVFILDARPSSSATTNGTTAQEPTLYDVLIARAAEVSRPRSDDGTVHFGLMLLSDGALLQSLGGNLPTNGTSLSHPLTLSSLLASAPSKAHHPNGFSTSLTLHLSPYASLSSPSSAAKNLFSYMRHHDDVLNVDGIFVEAVEEKGVGMAVMERLRKAAGGEGVEVQKVRVDPIEVVDA